MSNSDHKRPMTFGRGMAMFAVMIGLFNLWGAISDGKRRVVEMEQLREDEMLSVKRQHFRDSINPRQLSKRHREKNNIPDSWKVATFDYGRIKVYYPPDFEVTGRSQKRIALRLKKGNIAIYSSSLGDEEYRGWMDDYVESERKRLDDQFGGVIAEAIKDDIFKASSYITRTYRVSQRKSGNRPIVERVVDIQYDVWKHKNYDILTETRVSTYTPLVRALTVATIRTMIDRIEVQER